MSLTAKEIEFLVVHFKDITPPGLRYVGLEETPAGEIRPVYERVAE